ncbi:hypothetical protein RIF29_27477 [Crotalaria pallida]|uniref:GDSL esterase/lipase n=1 Tax=Crotalaria pallida TaxID=3830 RepID=A0AAN9I0H3_CROPI
MDRLHIETLLMIVLVFFANNVPIASAAYAAFFAFGDSILDTGNNNNLETFTKGLGIKDTLPAYNDPNLRAQYFPTGVCFSSGGSGSDNVTSCLLVMFFGFLRYPFAQLGDWSFRHCRAFLEASLPARPLTFARAKNRTLNHLLE